MLHPERREHGERQRRDDDRQDAPSHDTYFRPPAGRSQSPRQPDSSVCESSRFFTNEPTRAPARRLADTSALDRWR